VIELPSADRTSSHKSTLARNGPVRRHHAGHGGIVGSRIFINPYVVAQLVDSSGIRCGWILAQPELVRRVWQIVDFTYGSPFHPAELLAVIALDSLDHVRDRARALLGPNRALMNDFLAQHPELDCEASQFGTMVFPRLKVGSAEEFVTMLREQFETSVVPGNFFDHPQYFRIGFCGATEMVRGGLERLSAAPDAFEHASG